MTKEDFNKANEINKKLIFLDKVREKLIKDDRVIMVGSLRLDEDMDFHTAIKEGILIGINSAETALNIEFEKI